jgi:hypothetical protein
MSCAHNEGMKIFLTPSTFCPVTELVEVLPWSLIFKTDTHELG